MAAARGGAEAELARLQEQVAQREALQADLATETARLDEMRGSLSSATRTAMRAAAGLALVGHGDAGSFKGRGNSGIRRGAASRHHGDHTRPRHGPRRRDRRHTGA